MAKTKRQGGGRRLRPHGPRAACEESDRGVVAMNHSRKDGPSSAESEGEGCGSRRTLSHLTRARHRAGHASRNPVRGNHIQHERLTAIPWNQGFCEETLGEFFYDKSSDEVRLVEHRARNCAHHDSSTHIKRQLKINRMLLPAVSLGYLQGSVSFQPAGETDWVQAVPDVP